MRKLLNNKIITYFYLLILFLGTVLPLNSVSSPLNDNYTLHIRWDYLLHALVYIPLPVLLGLCLRKGSSEKPEKRVSNIRFWIRIATYSLLISTMFEAIQLIIPYRAFNINDMIANGVGVILGFILFLFFGKYLKGSLKVSADSTD